MGVATDHALPKRTPLHALHVARGAKMVPFAGYEMPLHYKPGLLKEHLHTRAAAGLFDVSHMGQLAIVPRSGRYEDAARALEALVPIDVLGLPPGRQRYGFLTNDGGGVLDDLMVSRLGNRLILVVNASRRVADEAHLRAHLADTCIITANPDALLALQGPGAEEALAKLAPEVAGLRFMDVREIVVSGTRCVVARSGYTGEDGFEIAVPADGAADLAEALLSDETVLPIGLGARDSLRLEAGLCLYGADLDEATSPIEAGLRWAIPPVRRHGGAREGGFPGASRVLDEIEHGAARRRAGLRPLERTPVRAGAPLFAGADEEKPIGLVTSGGFGPSLEAPVAMGFVPTAWAEPDSRLFAEVRGQRLPLAVSKLPFVPAGFKRS